MENRNIVGLQTRECCDAREIEQIEVAGYNVITLGTWTVFLTFLLLNLFMQVAETLIFL
jgi:hypothetical protein